MREDFFKMFDKKKFLLVAKLLFVFISLVIIANIAGNSYTRYESNVDVSANASVAYFVIDQGLYVNQIYIDGLAPSNDAKYYSFYVTNKKDNKRAEVDLEYTIKFETTTNLPLEYEIIRNQSFSGTHTNILNTPTLRQDENDVYYKVYTTNGSRTFSHLSDEVDQYTVKVTFPLQHKDSPDSYQGVIEMFSVIINASQVA